MKKCSYCGAQIADGSRFCSECGKEITQANVCPHCGASVGDGDAFCQNCGKSLNEAPSSEPITYEEEQPKRGFKKYLPYILGGILLLGIIGYLSSMGSNEGNNNPSLVADSVSVEDEDTEKPSKQEEIKLITEWYDYVFVKKEISDDVLNKFLSSNVKKRIWTEDYEGCYEFWKFRTVAQDYDPNVGNVSKIKDISVNNDGWYEVKYLDMGYNGKTTIKVENSKIIDFIPDSSWSNNDSSVGNRADNETIADDNSDYSSSNTSSSSRTFYSEQIVIGYLANQSFRASDGLTMRVDGDGRLYVDGDYAGVLSVLRYNETAALLRYGGGQYGEGKLSVQIVGDKFQLTDPTDGTVYYQR